MRSLTPIAIGLVLALATLAFVACSAVDPVPPDPHNHPDPEPLVAGHDGGDGGEEAGR
jgi:hypothetical protein